VGSGDFSYMQERRVGIRELKSKLSECVREVKRGSTILVTDHGKAVARLVPQSESVEERIEALRKSGVISWSGRRLRAARPRVRTHGKRTVSDILVENRE
jgi:prevent-host-death family protein